MFMRKCQDADEYIELKGVLTNNKERKKNKNKKASRNTVYVIFILGSREAI